MWIAEMCGKKQFPTSGLPLFFLVAGPVLGAILFFTLKSFGWESDACWTAAVSAVCAVWWIFEPVPIPVTSLLPFALFPILGVLSPREISESYGAPLILLLLGGFKGFYPISRSWIESMPAVVMTSDTSTTRSPGFNTCFCFRSLKASSILCSGSSDSSIRCAVTALFKQSCRFILSSKVTA